MHIVHELDETRIAQLHEFFSREWWTAGRSLDETRRCVEGSQICIGLVDDAGGLIPQSRDRPVRAGYARARFAASG